MSENYIVSKSAFQSPVIDVLTGDVLGRSSIAIFRKKNMFMAYLVVNVEESDEYPTDQILIPFSDIESMSDDKISVWVSSETPPEDSEPLSKEEYTQLFDTPVYSRYSNAVMGHASGAVIGPEGKLLALAVQNDDRTKRYTRGMLSRNKNKLFVDDDFEMEEEETPIRSQTAKEAEQEEQSQEKAPRIQPNTSNEALEALMKDMSQQLSALTGFLMESKEEKQRQEDVVMPAQMVQETAPMEEQEAETLQMEEAPVLNEPVFQQEEAPMQVSDFENEELQKSSEPSANGFENMAYQEVLAMMERLEGKIDRLTQNPSVEPMEMPKYQPDFAAEQMSEQSPAEETMDLQEPDFDELSFDLPEPEKTPLESISLKQPMQEGRDGAAKEKLRIDLAPLMEELDMQEKNTPVGETTETYKMDEPMPLDEPKTEQKTRAKHAKPAQKRSSTFWKVSGSQTLGAVLFATGYMAMNLFNVL